jgi:phage-related protein
MMAAFPFWEWLWGRTLCLLTSRLPSDKRILFLVCTLYGTLLSVEKDRKPSTGTQPEALERQGKRVPAIFFRTEAGGEPVREWLRRLSPGDRKRVGEDVKTVEFGWPIGMPVCRPLGDGVYEVRSSLAQNRIGRVLFYIDKKGRMVLLHGFIKKTQKTPDEHLELARGNKKKHQRGLP